MIDYGKGAIGVPCREQGRWSTFWECLSRLDRPAATLLKVKYNNSVAQARNSIVTEALAEGCDWIFWLDDDLLFKKDVLMRLLQRPEQIVLGLTLMRATSEGQFFPIWSNQRVDRSHPPPIEWLALRTIEPQVNGLVRLTSGTGGGVLTRRAVFDTVPGPWWQQGQYDPEMFWEDIFFYERAVDAGFQVWGDPSVRFGHYTASVIWPHQRADGSWSTVLAHGTDGFLEMPWIQPEPALATKE